MRKMIITLVLIVNAISLFGQSRTEIYDYFMVPKEFEYNYTDEDGYTSTRRFTVKSAILNFKNDELVGFTLKSDGKAQASFKVYKWINNTPKGMQFWVDDSMQYFVTIVNHSEIEDGLAIIFTSNVNGSPIFGAHFKKRLTAEEKQLREEHERERQRQLEEQERVRKAKEKADSLAAAEKAIADSISIIKCIQEYTQTIEENESIIQSIVEGYEIEYYKRHTEKLSRDLYNENSTNSWIFACNLEKNHEVYVYVEGQHSFIPIKIDAEVLNRDIWYSNEVTYNPKKYEVNGVTYIAYGNGFIYKTEVKTNLYAGYSGGGLAAHRKKDRITYNYIIGHSTLGNILGRKIESQDIPSVISVELDDVLSEDGKYEIDYVFAQNTLLELTVTKQNSIVYHLYYDKHGEKHVE